MGLEKIVISLLTGTIKNVSKFETGIDSIQKKFENGCPVRSELLKFINVKNQTSNALIQIQSKLQILDKTEITLNVSNKIFKKIITVVKNLPAPTSVPPGVGIPISVVTNLSSILDAMGDKLKQGDGILKIIPEINKNINSQIDNINKKIQLLDDSILKCLEEDLDKLDEDDKLEFLSELGLSIKESLPDEESISLEDQLTIGSKNPFQHNGYVFILERDNTNNFPFPRRRVRATKGRSILLGEFSYSSSTDILIDEMKFKINNL